MKKSTICIYCGKPIKKSKNADDGRSVEHLIPQSAVSKRRSNAEGDFHVCRKCNTEKSKIDELFGLLSRVNLIGESAKESAQKLAKIASKGNKAVINMMNNAKHKDNGVEVRLPFKGQDIYKYGVFLTKGEYFKQTGLILNLKSNVVLVKWGGYNLIQELLRTYKANHGTDPFIDLSLNKNVENINKECFIVSGNNAAEFIFFFNRAYALITNIVDMTEENKIIKRENIRSLITGFSRSKTNEYCV